MPPADDTRARRTPPKGAAWPSAAIFGAGLMASVFGAYLVRQVETRGLERETATVASALAVGIGDAFDEQIEALRRRKLTWTASGVLNGPPFHEVMAIFLAEHPAFTAVARVDGGRVEELSGAVGAEQDLRALLARMNDAGDPRPQRETERLVGPEQTRDGKTRLGVRIPLTGAGGRGDPALLAVFDPQQSLARWIERRYGDFGVRVRIGELEVYASAPPEAAGSVAISAPVVVSLGEPWLVTAAPTLATLEHARGQAPLIVLLFGLVISALISSLFHVGNLSRLRARELQRTNVDLYDEIEKTRRGESEIRRLNASLEKRVEERTAALNETIGELETFNYSVSHDLRSPLGAIINFTAILKEDYDPILDEAGRDHLDRLLASARSAVVLMDGLLAFSRSGRETINKEVVRMRSLAESVGRELRGTAPSNAFTIEIGEIPDAFADPGMMRTVWLNLIQNAFRFTAPGEGAFVEIGGSEKQDEVSYFVRDRGVGFDMRFADKLFKPFERLHPTDRASGSGVGLAIVERILRRHGGRIEAHGAVGQGATFSFTLPKHSDVVE